MLLLALTALILPAVFQLVHGGGLPGVGEERVDFGSDLEQLSFGVAIVLMRQLRRRPDLLAEDPPQRSSTRSSDEEEEDARQLVDRSAR